MRTLKFRAWDACGEQMVSPDYIARNGLAWWKENSIPTSSDKVMQFTGLLDKNGTEIYEGDIVISKFGDFKPFIIAFGEYPDKKASTNIGFYIVAGGSFDCGFGRSAEGDTECFKVIGNIYENPQLLL